jgi:aminopeptidase N
VHPSFPEIDHELRFLVAHYPAAYAVDRSAGTHPIRRELRNLLEAGSLYGAIIYRKAPIVMRDLERRMGEERFRDGVREYLSAHRFGNASWRDLIAILDRRTDEDLAAWSRTWVEGAGMPRIRAAPRTIPEGYGYVEYDADSWKWLLETLPDLEDPVTRGRAWIHVWEGMLRGKMSGDEFLSLAARALPSETDDLIVNRVLAYVERAFWIFSRRPEDLSRVLWWLLERAPTRSLKAAYFAAYRGVVLDPGKLLRIWGGEEIPGLPLSEQDHMTLALELRVRGQDVLEGQLERIRDPDRKARFRFVMRAFEPGFFESLRDPKNREREPWVLEAVSYLQHPLRPREDLILPALELLEEIRRTGDIFFPERWAAATLSGHRSRGAAEIVRKFVKRSMDPRLREKVLQAADLLFRAASDI